jgi:putative ABC transport system ATP-binding protein
LQMIRLSKIYRTKWVETHALRNIDIEVKEGEFVAIVGPSGSGKSSFLNIAGLLEQPSGGMFRFEGDDVSVLTDKQRSALRSRKIGFIFQGFNMIQDMDVYENIEVPLRYARIANAERSRRINASLEDVGISSRARHRPPELSGGQQQRAAIARAIAIRPRLLLADEPTGNLDTEMAHGILGLLREINARGTTILMVTHDAAIAAHAQRMVHIVDGAVVSDAINNKHHDPNPMWQSSREMP